ncbi:MAG TPA: hypothetical protein VFQ38_21725 [Longimicrobiales bacterium]|nr:hypothetical protein [Longimicrobiales bacterium]
MDETNGGRVLLPWSELRAAVALIGARFPDPEAERSRLVLARRYLAEAAELERALEGHLRCALVDHSGSTGAHSLAEATERLFGALAGFAARVSELAEGCRALGVEPAGAPAPARAQDAASRRLHVM